MTLPGGMEELSLDEIRKKSELEEEIDFEKGDPNEHKVSCF